MVHDLLSAYYCPAMLNWAQMLVLDAPDTKSDDVNVVFLDVEVDTSVLSRIANTFSLTNKVSSSANQKVRQSLSRPQPPTVLAGWQRSERSSSAGWLAGGHQRTEHPR